MRQSSIFVKDGNVHLLLQGLLDDEALGRLDIFEIDAAEGGPHQAHRIDEFIRVFGIELDVDRIDVGKALEQHRLALHHRLGAERAEISEAQNRGAVGDHRDQIALVGIVIGQLGIGGDILARDRDAGGIGEREIALGGHRHGGLDFPLAGSRIEMEAQGVFAGELGFRHHFFPCMGLLPLTWAWALSQPKAYCGKQGLSRRSPGL